MKPPKKPVFPENVPVIVSVIFSMFSEFLANEFSNRLIFLIVRKVCGNCFKF